VCPPGGGQQYCSRLAAHQWATSSSGNLRMRVWVAQWVAQWQAPPMMQRLLSKEWICFHQGAGMGHGQGARGAGRGQGSGVEWSGVGERERRARKARPPGKATSELVQLRHSSVLLLQFARLRLRCCRHIIRWCPRCQTASPSLDCSSLPSFRTSSPRTALLRTTEDGCCSLDRL
jgi:hypothetical protein